MNNKVLSQKIIEQMIKDRKIRTAVIRKSHKLFFYFYFSHYVEYEIAPFQKEFFHLSERTETGNLYIVAFRGSGKSTIFTLSYPIWAILGEQRKKFVLVLCQTRNQAKQHMMNLKRELESNQLLKNDLGPFQEENDEWGSSSLVFSRLSARITAASTEQSIRGLRHNQYRPDLIIGDDVEDIASTKTREGRDKTYQWLTSEVIPAGDRNTRIVIIGNLLHEDSLLMRLRRNLEEVKIEGTFKFYPLLDSKGNCLWPGKYPDAGAIKDEKKKVGNEIAWHREYLLHIIPDTDQVILPKWIKRYRFLPQKNRAAYLAVDPAVSEKDSADLTAMVVVVIEGYGEKFCARVFPNPINRRMRFPETVVQIKALYNSLKLTYPYLKIIVEDVACQKAFIQQLENERYPVEGIKVTSDKHSRLVVASNLMQTGKVLFPEKGADDLIQQMVGFGVDRYDDLVDAFTLAAQKIIEEDIATPGRLSDFYSEQDSGSTYESPFSKSSLERL